TVARPPAEKETLPLSGEEMERAAAILMNYLPGVAVEAVGEFGGKRKSGRSRDPAEAAIAYLRRRPATARDLSRALGLPSVLVRRTLASLLAAGKVRKGKHGPKMYYRISG
ncbi:MAG: winged helix-turn-helix domain-containing protein, partial [Candidatus Aureabacteria bacterium]|nr:winged helix-turn-helix domain-containing protein [Candidatus Auribacterota bacterium]